MAAPETSIAAAPAVEVRGLTKDYGPRRVLEVDHFAVRQGSVSALVGPNGSGKTTLLALVALLEAPTSGTVRLWGEDASPRARRERLRRRVVMVHERPWMFHTTVLGNACYGLAARGAARQEAQRRAMAALEAVGMAHAAGRAATRLSAGEVRRVALARALALEPDLLLLDEPLADVDAQHAAAVERVVGDQARRGATVVLATHRLETAYRLAKQCVTLVGGRLSEARPDNHFAGTVAEEDGEPVMQIAPGTALRLATPLRGPAHVIIDARTVVLSRDVPDSSARNHFLGRIVSLAVEGDRVRVTVDVGVPLIALVTGRSVREMGLELGEPIAVLVKTVSLDVYGGRGE